MLRDFVQGGDTGGEGGEALGFGKSVDTDKEHQRIGVMPRFSTCYSFIPFFKISFQQFSLGLDNNVIFVPIVFVLICYQKDITS